MASDNTVLTTPCGAHQPRVNFQKRGEDSPSNSIDCLTCPAVMRNSHLVFPASKLGDFIPSNRTHTPLFVFQLVVSTLTESHPFSGSENLPCSSRVLWGLPMARNWNSLQPLVRLEVASKAASGVSVASSTMARMRSEWMPWMLATALAVEPSSTAMEKMAFLSSPLLACNVVFESTIFPGSFPFAVEYSIWMLAQARFLIILAVVEVRSTVEWCGSASHQVRA